jgi:Uma2 family endonuclease
MQQEDRAVSPRTAEQIPTPRLHLTPADASRALSIEEFEGASAEEGYRYELIHGRLVVSPVPNLSHEDVVEWIVEALRAYARTHPEVINRAKAPARVFVPDSDDTAPEPDVACYHDYPTRLPLDQRDWRLISPVLVVEVLSPDNADKDRERNVELYLRVPSIREYWIIDPLEDPNRPSLTVRRRRGQRWQKPIEIEFGESYETRLLPGLTLVVDPRTYDG